MAKPATAAAKKPHSGQPTWQWRRLTLLGIVGFCMWMIWSMQSAGDTQVNQLIVEGCFWTLIVIALVYTGFATAQDISAIIMTRSGRPYQQEMQPATPERVGDSIPDPAADPNKPPEGMAT